MESKLHAIQIIPWCLRCQRSQLLPSEADDSGPVWLCPCCGHEESAGGIGRDFKAAFECLSKPPGVFSG